jgi:hypothetical protein
MSWTTIFCYFYAIVRFRVKLQCQTVTILSFMGIIVYLQLFLCLCNGTFCVSAYIQAVRLPAMADVNNLYVGTWGIVSGWGRIADDRKYIIILLTCILTRIKHVHKLQSLAPWMTYVTQNF